MRDFNDLLVNGDLDGKAIHCYRLVKGPFQPTNSWSISFWASLSFCALGPLREREGSFTRTQKIGKLGRRHTDEVQPRLYLSLLIKCHRVLRSMLVDTCHRRSPVVATNLESLGARTVGIPLRTRRASVGDGIAR